jgi:hypothetical protein
MKRLLLLGVALLGLAAPFSAQAADKLLNASYDVARELFAAENEAFVKGHPGVTVDQSHGGTSKQARAIVEGLEADVVTFNQVTDIDFLVKNGFVAEGWQQKFPNNASPFYSFPSFLVRAGNPKNIKDWSDLARDDVKVIFPNPKTSGNARYTYLAATAYAKEAFNNDPAKVEEFVTKIFDNVPVFDTKSAMSSSPSRRKPSRSPSNMGRTSSKASYPPSRCLPSSRSPSSTRWPTPRAAVSLQSPTSISFMRQRARRSLPNSAIASMTRRSLPSSRASSRKSAS